ncbi:Outer membrane protein assembly factor BamB, contains PQQ-like beta-propeller repeat [Mariniphaga anaerophila]|uniref:Outer membrane protein assembly factor BamB, contains PQQ-like beta-propeller repeat n=1 Tax=Mariniphaga anaerophila TaxID=1484053 RepID=A0A1M5DPY1_9BACT|nr:PQQ-binding-like beta-propeller repeat protein [Mariniphaga anaerophila]SHF68842.1 Outer membrane protein assembly factor BamB, contains PQQ-like beta-propeller repeat [Mariniphaga anaerophila]
MKIVLWSVVLVAFVFTSEAQVIQWRGPNRDGKFPETGLLKEWPEAGPDLILETEGIGKGWSSPILADNMIYTTGMIDTLDYLTAMDLQGNVKWQVSYGRSWNQSFPDTRCTPVVDGDKIYVQSGTGRVACIQRETGKEVWAVNVDTKFHGEYHLWGNSETPLIVDDLVICSPGGHETSIIALNKFTGETAWETKSVGGPRAYASATIYEYRNFRYILAVTGTHLLAIKPEKGEVAWNYKYYNPDLWDREGLIWTNTPVFNDDEIFLTMGYDYFAVMLKMDSTGTSVSEKFIDHTLDNHHHGVILHDGHLYGSNWYDNRRGRWVCMVWDTGEIKYVDDWDTKGALVMADEMLYAYNERGNVGLVKPTPNGFEVVSQFRITKGAGPHWAHPFISDGKLLMRHGDVLLVFDIKGN